MSQQSDPPGLVTTPVIRQRWWEDVDANPDVWAWKVRQLLTDLELVLSEHAAMRERLARYEREPLAGRQEAA